MSSYVAVAGIPSGDTCSIFGLTPQEIRYLQVSIYIFWIFLRIFAFIQLRIDFNFYIENRLIL